MFSLFFLPISLLLSCLLVYAFSILSFHFFFFSIFLLPPLVILFHPFPLLGASCVFLIPFTILAYLLYIFTFIFFLINHLYHYSIFFLSTPQTSLLLFPFFSCASLFSPYINYCYPCFPPIHFLPAFLTLFLPLLILSISSQSLYLFSIITFANPFFFYIFSFFSSFSPI